VKLLVLFSDPSRIEGRAGTWKDERLKMKQKISSGAGFTMIEIMIVVSLVGLLATIAVPNYWRAHRDSQTATCINNLRQIDAAIQQYATERKRGAKASVTLADCCDYLKQEAVCPAGGTTIVNSYSVTDCQTSPTCITKGGGTANGHVLP
jgi:prepilin-type N-terminal cleavage/methylation domain-containing protein